MANIQQKLRENKGNIRREKFLSALDLEFSEFLSHVEYSSEEFCIRNAAFPVRDEAAHVVTSSRGKVKNWNNFNFKKWQELVAILKKFQKVKDYIGWFFIERDGPYYRISLKAFFSHITDISNYGVQNEHYNFGWVGEADDVGIIIEESQIGASEKKFSICIWGL